MGSVAGLLVEHFHWRYYVSYSEKWNK